jgi:prepilin-type N-terminal cleavage/methylation domain-containing protein
MSSNKQTGFTIVELLIVVVVIAILAAITIVSYNGITTQANRSAAQSEVSSAGKAIESYKTVNGVYPATLLDAGVKADASKKYTVSQNTGFCISSTMGTVTYKMNSLISRPQEGGCGVNGNVTAFAGNADSGSANGTGTSARFNSPSGIARDSAGNVYVADLENHQIRKVTPAGVVSTYAGSGVAGSANGVGTAAQFDYPQDVAVDAQGIVYVADTDNNQVRRILPTGEVQNFATVSSVVAVGINPEGGLYAAGMGTTAIYKISSTGAVSTWIANPTTQCRYPYDFASASNGDLYTATINRHTICKITPAGVVSVYAGQTSGNTGAYTDGIGTAARFYSPSGLAFDSQGTLYVADSNNAVIRKIDTNGLVSTVAGSVGNFGYANGAGGAANFDAPWGIVVTPNDELIVSDWTSLRKIQ